MFYIEHKFHGSGLHACIWCVVGPWLSGVVEVIVIWTVATAGYENLLDTSVPTGSRTRVPVLPVGLLCLLVFSKKRNNASIEQVVKEGHCSFLGNGQVLILKVITMVF